MSRTEYPTWSGFDAWLERATGGARASSTEVLVAVMAPCHRPKPSAPAGRHGGHGRPAFNGEMGRVVRARGCEAWWIALVEAGWKRGTVAGAPTR